MKKEKKLELFISVVALCIMLVIVVITSNLKSSMENATIYSCNYHSLNIFKTKIDIRKDEESYATIEGEIAKIVEDPLTLKDNNGIKIGTAGDEYHLIAQDSHSISINDQPYIEMVGEFELLGEEYTLYNSNGEFVGTVIFNLFGTNGVFSDKDGNIIAEYNSGWLRKDYKVTISNDSSIDSNAILLVFASYASDFNFDNK